MTTGVNHSVVRSALAALATVAAIGAGLVAATAAPALATSAVEVPVPGSAGPLNDPFFGNGVVDTGVDVTASVDITATGEVTYLDEGDATWGPDGNGETCDNTCLGDGLAQWSLIGKIGDGPWQDVGSGLTELTGTGRLYLAPNDSNYEDNTGQYDAEITVPPVEEPNPFATTDEAVDVTDGTATLTGTLNPGGNPMTYFFEWGTTTDYGNQTETQDAGAGTDDIDVSADLTDLQPDTTYHYQLVMQFNQQIPSVASRLRSAGNAVTGRPSAGNRTTGTRPSVVGVGDGVWLGGDVTFTTNSAGSPTPTPTDTVTAEPVDSGGTAGEPSDTPTPTATVLGEKEVNVPGTTGTPQLPFTGGPVGALALAGVALLLAGGALVLTARDRRRRRGAHQA